MQFVGSEQPAIEGMLMRAQLLERLINNGVVEDEPREANSRFVWSKGVTAVVAFLVGTGGILSPTYVAARDERGYRLQEFGYPSPVPANGKAKLRFRSSAENLALVREVFKPTVTELASLLGVSRQAIYNWQAGQPIAEQNDARLEQLASAADLLQEEGLASNPGVMRRKLPGGKTLFESVRAGAAADTAAAALVAMLKHESTQRQSVAGRLANRTRKPVDASEIGAPYLDERA